MKTNQTQTQQLIDLYKRLQTKPWGQSNIVEGFYHIGRIDEVESPIPNRKQAVGYTYWKQYHEDIFNTDVVFPIPLGALYNKHSKRPTRPMDNLLGRVICIEQLGHETINNKSIYYMSWQLVDDMDLPPADLEL